MADTNAQLTVPSASVGNSDTDTANQPGKTSCEGTFLIDKFNKVDTINKYVFDIISVTPSGVPKYVYDDSGAKHDLSKELPCDSHNYHIKVGEEDGTEHEIKTYNPELDAYSKVTCDDKLYHALKTVTHTHRGGTPTEIKGTITGQLLNPDYGNRKPPSTYNLPDSVSRVKVIFSLVHDGSNASNNSSSRANRHFRIDSVELIMGVSYVFSDIKSLRDYLQSNLGNKEWVLNHDKTDDSHTIVPISLADEESKNTNDPQFTLLNGTHEKINSENEGIETELALQWNSRK